MDIKEKLKNIRPEYWIAGVFALILVLYYLYTLVMGVFFDGNERSKRAERTTTTTQSTSTSPLTTSSGDATRPKSTISDAVSRDRPLILSTSARKQEFNSIMSSSPEIKGMELAIETEKPTVWIYTFNNGTRLDDKALQFCEQLHSRGIMATRVTILDESARTKGKIIEIGDAKCSE